MMYTYAGLDSIIILFISGQSADLMPCKTEQGIHIKFQFVKKASENQLPESDCIKHLFTYYYMHIHIKKYYIKLCK